MPHRKVFICFMGKIRSDRLLNLAGLCRRAGGIIPGAEATYQLIRNSSGRDSPIFVIISSDASLKTVKRITDSASFYKIEAFQCDKSSDQISRALGIVSPCVVFAAINRGPSQPLLEAAREEAVCLTLNKRFPQQL